MKALGYPLTYATRCFIDGGCGTPVFAHTNGTGDFVLFDKLGWPWPVHDCFLNRFCGGVTNQDPQKGCDVFTDLELNLSVAHQNEEYKKAARKASEDRARPPARQITKVEPVTSQKLLTVVGYVQDFVEKKAARLSKGAGTLGEQIVRRAIGHRESQLTIIDNEFHSYTAFADLSRTVIGKRMTVVAKLRVVNIVGTGNVFICDSLDSLRITE